MRSEGSQCDDAQVDAAGQSCTTTAERERTGLKRKRRIILGVQGAKCRWRERKEGGEVDHPQAAQEQEPMPAGGAQVSAGPLSHSESEPPSWAPSRSYPAYPANPAVTSHASPPDGQ
jgi:hypothetical protein